MTDPSFPPDQSIDDILVSIKKSYTNPSIGRITQVVLKDGPRTFRAATLLEIKNPNTDEIHHYDLKIFSLDKQKKGWFQRADRSISLSGADPDEISKLFQFLQAHTDGSLSEKYADQRLVTSDDYRKLEALLESLPNLASKDKLALVRTVLPSIESGSADTGAFIAAFEGGSTSTLSRIASSARTVEYRRTLEQLRELVADASTPEQALQKHLNAHPWLFGSEYSKLIDRRTWTRDNNLDFMLRRTVDDYLEIIEIKTPFSQPLFNYDKSHDSYYPSSKLSTVIGQVMRYIEETERNRDAILAKDKVDTLKIRARVIVGRNGDAHQQEALRNLNAHLHRIEIFTFDQLVRVGERVLAMLNL